MNKIRTCENKCIFCFVSQMPPNMRHSLYIKDDDYIKSFTNGNFITLTNVSKEEIEKIIKFGIKPLHISVHSFDNSIRDLLFGSKNHRRGIENIIKLDSSGITSNIQIVLCPGINDGKDLENTLDILINQFRNVVSIGIVPVGITRFNNEPGLKAFDRSSSIRLIRYIDDYKESNKNNRNSSRIYLADEFYLLALHKFPEHRSYGRFDQIKNGIGKTSDFIYEIKQYLIHLSKKNQVLLKDNILIVTSEYGRKVFKEIEKIISKFNDRSEILRKLHIDCLTVKNQFFGGNIKVTGLLTGTDIIKELNKISLKKYHKVLIPSVIFNHDGLTLDDSVREDFTGISDKISFVSDSGRDLVKKIFKLKNGVI